MFQEWLLSEDSNLYDTWFKATPPDPPAKRAIIYKILERLDSRRAEHIRNSYPTIEPSCLLTMVDLSLHYACLEVNHYRESD